MHLTVLGAGVSGLTSALVLARAGHRVQVVAARRTPATTSDVPAAFFFPYGVTPGPRARRRLRRSALVFGRLALRPETGVSRRPARARLPASTRHRDWWLDVLPGPCRLVEDGDGVLALGFCGIVVDVRRYLPWLEDRLQRAKVAFHEGEVASLSAVDADLVVNCTGLGAGPLTGDAALYPSRGQIVRVCGAGVDEVRVDETRPDAPLYVVPRGDDCIVGGTFEPGATDLSPDPAARARLLDRAREQVPALAGARWIEDRVGLRPMRPEPRVELTWHDGRPVVHNYGHGGAGVTLSWGTAAEVADLVARAAHRRVRPCGS